jgi:MFS family permease
MASDSAGSITGWAAFRSRDFAFVFATSMFSGIATNALQIAIGWEMWEATREPIYLGLVGLFAFLPSLLFFPVTGMIADRYPRRLILAACYSLQICTCIFLLLAFEGGDPLIALGVISLNGVASAFSMPASQALLPNVVPAAHFPNAVAWSSSGRQVAMIAGPAIGGALLVSGTVTTFVAIAAMFAGALVLIALVRAKGQERVRGPITFAVLFAGLKFIFERQIVLGAISLDLFAVIAGSATAIFPIYATDVLHVGELGLGFLRSVWAAGATVCALALTHVPIRHHAGTTLFVTVAVFGLAMAVFGISTVLWLSLAALFIAGAADMVSVFIRDNMVQLATPDAMRGRVQAVNSVFTMGSGHIGQLKSGLLAEVLGAVPAVVAGGLAVLVITAAWAGMFPRLRRVDALSPEEVSEGAPTSAAHV